MIWSLPALHDCGCLDISSEGVITDVNDTFASWVGSERDQIVGLHYSEVIDLRMPSPSDDLVPGDAVVRTSGGLTRPVAVGRISTGEDGTTQVAAFDVSPESGFSLPFAVGDARSDRGKRRLQILYNASVGFAETRSDREAAELLADVAKRAFAASAVSVHLTAEGTLKFVAGENPLADDWPQGYRPTGARTLEAGEVVVVGGPDDAERFAPGVGMPSVFRAAGVHSAIAAPIRSKGTSLGSFICYFDHPRLFDEEAVPLAEALANQTAQALQRSRFETALRRAALHDEVTGLPSRRLIEEQVAQALADGTAVPAVMFIDLDGFKRVNDTLGHAAGDALLNQVGQRLRSVVRDGDLIGRFGGDEFIAVAHVHDGDEAAAIAERIRASLDAPFAGIAEKLRVTASIGVTVATSKEDLVLDRLLRTADQTMYRAKLAGGNRIALAVDDDVTVIDLPAGPFDSASVSS